LAHKQQANISREIWIESYKYTALS